MALLKALLDSGSINTFQHATVGAVFSLDECYGSLLGSTTILATVGEGCFLCVGTNLLSCTAQHRSFRIDYHLFYIYKCVL
jgi:hypothetical protein